MTFGLGRRPPSQIVLNSSLTGPRSRAFALAVIAGILYFVGFVGFGQFYLTWFAFVPALFAVRGAGRGRAGMVGLVFGTVTMLGGYYWVIHLLREFAYLPLPLAFLGYVLLCMYQGASLMVILLLVRAAAKRGVAPVWSLALAIAAVEPFYPFLFPHYVGNSEYRFTAICQIVEIFGLPGLGALIGLVNGAAYELVDARFSRRRPSPARLLVPGIAFAGALIFGLVRISEIESQISAAPKLEVALIQTNLGARDKKAKELEFRRRHVEMSLEAEAAHPSLDLIVWPESAVNRPLPRPLGNVRDVMPGLRHPLIFGALTYDREDGLVRAFNSAVLTSSTAEVRGYFDKVRLLAFGETIPFVDTFPWLKKWFSHTGLFTRGSVFEHFVLEDGTRLLPMVCYEDILPDFVRSMWRKAGPADVLVNVTNDSWYGDTHEPLIHLVLASFRSIETRRALIRSTNTGISALVDPLGRIQARTGQWKREILVGEVPLIRDGGATWFIKLGPLLAYAAVVALLVLIGLRKLR